MKTIIVPIDFSSISLNAAEYAVEMARSINVPVSLLNVWVLPATYSEVPYPIENIDSLVSDAEKKILEVRNDLEKMTGGKVKIDTKVTVGATVIGELINYCKSRNPYYVVMGTHGNDPLKRVFFGSNTVNAIKHLAWPVIVVPPDAKFTSIKRIGLACDLKNVEGTIPFTRVKSLVNQFNAELYILHINPEGEKGYTAEKTIESRYIQNRFDDLHPFLRFLDHDDVETGLEEFAETNNLDLLVTIPKKHTIIGKVFHKSHSKKLVLHTHVPVMALHD